MALMIGKKYKIASDELNVIVYKHHLSKTGREYWRPIGYFATPANALRFLVDLGIRETQLKDLETITKKQGELYSLIKGLALK